MSHLERTLRELETATEALAETPIENLQTALDRRSLAVGRVAELAGSRALTTKEREDALIRLRGVCDAAALAQQTIAMFRREAIAEWSAWIRIYRALGGDEDLRI